jgi:hypothetical protein
MFIELIRVADRWFAECFAEVDNSPAMDIVENISDVDKFSSPDSPNPAQNSMKR